LNITSFCVTLTVRKTFGKDIFMKQYYRLDFYVQKTQAANVRNAVLDAGAGRLGSYTHCAWETLGRSQRMIPGGPGQAGNVITSEEVKIEVIVGEDCLQDVIDALIAKHPSEQPVFCCYPVMTGVVEEVTE
jgi:hypothetical protein